jgi:methionine-rich copper-binding protein CopC
MSSMPSPWRGRVFGAVVAGLLGVLVWPVAAFAHATFVRSSPAPNAVVTTAPAVVRVLFSEAVAADGSALTVTGPGGVRVDQGDSRVDPSDPTGTTMVVSLRSGLQSGRYIVNWTTVSAKDGDKESGSFAFTIAGAAGTAPGMPRTGGGTALPAIGAAALLLTGWGIRLLSRAKSSTDENYPYGTRSLT